MAPTFSRPMASRSVIVESLAEDVTENDLRRVFSAVGLVDYVEILRPNRGLVVFVSATDGKLLSR